MIKTITLALLILSSSLVSFAQWAPCDTSEEEAVKNAFKKESDSFRVSKWQEHFDNYVAQHVFTTNQGQLEIMAAGLQFVESGEITDAGWIQLVNSSFTEQEQYEIFQVIPEYAPSKQQIEDELAAQQLLTSPNCSCSTRPGLLFVCGFVSARQCRDSTTAFPCSSYRNCGLFNLEICTGRCFTPIE